MQTVQMQIRLPIEEQSDQGLYYDHFTKFFCETNTWKKKILVDWLIVLGLT